MTATITKNTSEQKALISRRDFIKYSAISSLALSLPFNALAGPAESITYNLTLNSGQNLLLNAGGLLLFAQEFPGPFDSDGDGLDDQQEVLLGTDPSNPDTDGDTLSDGFEVGYDGDSSSYSAATDLNPLEKDTDSDGYPDNTELIYASNPIDASSTPLVAAPLFTPFV